MMWKNGVINQSWRCEIWIVQVFAERIPNCRTNRVIIPAPLKFVTRFWYTSLFSWSLKMGFVNLVYTRVKKFTHCRAWSDHEASFVCGFPVPVCNMEATARVGFSYSLSIGSVRLVQLASRLFQQPAIDLVIDVMTDFMLNKFLSFFQTAAATSLAVCSCVFDSGKLWLLVGEKKADFSRLFIACWQHNHYLKLFLYIYMYLHVGTECSRQRL